jgi:putative ABC transport system ATP-binding protein
VIRTAGLNKVFRTEEVETTALRNVTLEVQAGEFVAVMGPSGCGKTTLLNILGLLDNPTGGAYRFLDQDVSRARERHRAILRRRSVGFVFQSFNLIDELTVFENVELPLLYLRMPAARRRRRVEDLLEQMKIAARRGHHPHQLSGGQQQRVAVARAAVAEPALILADEPTGNLDSENGEEVMKLLTELNANGTTVMIVTHSPSYADYANRVIHLFDGRIVTENIVRVGNA